MKLKVIIHIRSNTFEVVGEQFGPTKQLEDAFELEEPQMNYVGGYPYMKGYTIKIKDIPYEVRND